MFFRERILWSTCHLHYHGHLTTDLFLSGRCSHILLTKTSFAASTAYSSRVRLLTTHPLLWRISSASNEPISTPPPKSFFIVVNSHLFGLMVNSLYLGPHMTGWRLSDQTGLNESGWRVLCIIWQYFSATTRKLPVKHFPMLWGTSQLGNKIVDQTSTRHHRSHIKTKGGRTCNAFRGLRSVINRWMRVIKQSRQETEKLKTKMVTIFSLIPAWAEFHFVSNPSKMNPLKVLLDQLSQQFGTDNELKQTAA